MKYKINTPKVPGTFGVLIYKYYFFKFSNLKAIIKPTKNKITEQKEKELGTRTNTLPKTKPIIE